MINPGMMISDRYEIIDRVGSGGMADVYKAKCHRLNRYVAIKVLKQEYAVMLNLWQNSEEKHSRLPVYHIRIL